MLNLNEKDETYDFDHSMCQLLSEIDDILITSPAQSARRTPLSVLTTQKAVTVNDVACPAVECNTMTGESVISE